jgi:hypothetical protein
MGLAERISAENDWFMDSWVVRHGFEPRGRDYDIVITAIAALRPDVPIGDSTGSYVEGRYRYRFTHCPEAQFATVVDDRIWREYWEEAVGDELGDSYPERSYWRGQAADTFPGLSILDSPRAARWAERFGREMYEVHVETNRWTLQLVCHDVEVMRLAVGDPRTGELAELDTPELVLRA